MTGSGKQERRTVIIVNDDAVQLTILSRLVEKDGQNVLACTGAEEALESMKGRPAPDLIVTDLHMPGIDGWRFCRLLRSPEFSEYNETPVLVVSATFSGEDSRQITGDLGANGFVPAPVNPTTFLGQVRALLAGQAAHAATRVLIVEDSATMSCLLMETFRSNGYEASSASTGAEAIELFREQRPEVLVLDYHLPDVNGDVLLEQFKRENPQCVVIMITTDPDPSLALDWMKKGAAAYARKALKSEYLITLCQNAQRERALLNVEGILDARTRELRDSEAKLRSAHEYLNTVIDAIPDTFFVIDRQHRIILANRAGRELAGGGDVIDAGGHCYEAFHRRSEPCGGIENPCPLARVAESKQPVQVTHRHCTADGGLRWVEVHASPIVDPEGEVVQVIEVCRDVTERKRDEEARLKLEAQIQQAQKSESLSTMAGSIAHNFNNLLMGVLGNLEMALEDLPPESSVAANVKAADAAATRAAELSRLMLTYVGRGRLDVQPVDMVDLVGVMTGVLEAAVAGRAVLTFDPAPEHAVINGDPSQVRQVMMNLVTNAAEAAGDSGGTITLSISKTFCDRSYLDGLSHQEDLAEGDYVRFEVADTGCGMNRETLERVFDPFFTTQFTGRGLGLAAVLGIVRAHRGAVGIESEPGKGTTVTVLFPSAEEPGPA